MMGDLTEHYKKVAGIAHRYKRRDLFNPEIFTFLKDIDLAEYISRGDSVLEVGCGQGNFLVDLRDNYGANVTGLDKFIPDVLADIPFVQGSAENLPFKDHSFDFVFSYFTFQYIPDKLKAIAEIHRVLKNGKRAIIDFGNLHPNATGMFDLHVCPCLDQIVLERNLEEQLISEEVWVTNQSHQNPRRANRVTIIKKTDSLSFPELKHFKTQEGNFPLTYSYY